MMDLKADLTRCVREGLSRSEILDFVRTLDRILKENQIFYNKKNLIVDDVRREVEIELTGREATQIQSHAQENLTAV